MCKEIKVERNIRIEGACIMGNSTKFNDCISLGIIEILKNTCTRKDALNILQYVRNEIESVPAMPEREQKVFEITYIRDGITNTTLRENVNENLVRSLFELEMPDANVVDLGLYTGT